MSGVTRQQASIVETQPEAAIGADGQTLLAKELVVLIALPKRDTNALSNVVIRGIGAKLTRVTTPGEIGRRPHAEIGIVRDHRGPEHRRAV